MSFTKTVRSLFAAALLLGLNSQFAPAQNTNAGEIRGTVTDPSGAVVPGVVVTVSNNDTGVPKQLLTNAAGIYDAVSILPGNYTLTFTKEGFSKLARTGVELSVGIITVDARLTLGAATQEVQVNAQAPQLQTETGQQSADLKSESMVQLPNVGQNWTNFTKMLPGVVGSGTSIAVNGNMKYEDNWLSDGGNITKSARAAPIVYTARATSTCKMTSSTPEATFRPRYPFCEGTTMAARSAAPS
jgi:hypothetical protein